ncbi:CDP-diacylglycerol--glycerol-3-phosphate 3-phosphatidyltransferase [Beutenbergia cavernae]|uniref:CDP-diacylglycerol--glycerol-3-phosphate 3-phosphatidyltransferase n=1 Tax=Beutenbergia cavernae TaxID=84757 RepID=UPI00019ACEC1|nr:CDP-diacylglycerol--glycerol-3-phosphate 3-phosphatidyltransferase [Beutenbergia cavernae]
MPPATPEPAAPGAQVWNLPNALTILRVLLVPVFAVLLLQDTTTSRLAATGVFVLAAATDRLDGQIARSRGQVTAFGKLADPIADKALTLTAFAGLSLLGEVPWWITLAITVRELGITLLRVVLVRRSIIAASTGGKVKTVLQILVLTVLLVPWDGIVAAGVADVIDVVALVLLYAALAVTIVTGLDYVVRAWRLARGR